MKEVLIIDNYDSFTYNLVHLVQDILGREVTVWRNDKIDYDSIQNFDYIILSPGPGIPGEAGDLKKVIKKYAGKIKMLGVCLGHQAIGEVFGAKLLNLTRVYHGVQTDIMQVADSSNLMFEDVAKTFDGGRYHSWVIEQGTLPSEFKVTSRDEAGEIMSFEHISQPIFGLQFHPESILTPEGKTMISNFLNS